MITTLNIPTFGIFKDFDWRKSVGINNVNTFRRVNIVYGRNYSGKTTISRILRCVEEGKLHPNYLDGRFTLTTEQGGSITERSLATPTTEFKVRVYNSDFVSENLSWLTNPDGSIKPFTILGQVNVDLQQKIDGIDKQLGQSDVNGGLLWEEATLRKEYESKSAAKSKKEKDVADKLTSKGSEIRLNPFLFLGTPSKKTYDKTDLVSDIKEVQKASSAPALPESEISRLRDVITEQALDDLAKVRAAKPNFQTYLSEVNGLLEKTIQPNIPLQRLVDNALLETWARQGLPLHPDNASTCGFCGNVIGADLWEKLSAHFSQESESLLNGIEKAIVAIETAKNGIDTYLTIDLTKVYKSLRPELDTQLKAWQAAKDRYIANLDALVQELVARKADKFHARKAVAIADNSAEIEEVLKAVNVVIEQHNVRSQNLVTEQAKARTKLRFAEVRKFITDFGYSRRLDEIEVIGKEAAAKNSLASTMRQEISALRLQRSQFEAAGKDESIGAGLVNTYLGHYFGHSELKLEAEKEGPKVRFRLERGGKVANNISNGEASLVSFCYFMARMNDELNEPTNSSKLIICIDDPISSLDNNHVFFMYSLIEAVIMKPQVYQQIFILTHHLDFLKYVKKLTIPKYLPDLGAKSPKDDVAHFLVERKSETNSVLRYAPKYLKDYVTEFNYLFACIYKCALSDVSDETIENEYHYSFGNNLRKFLEALMYFKYPNHGMTNDQRLRKFWGTDDLSFSLVNRVVNEYSHLESQFDRSLQPIDVDAIRKVAEAVMNRMREVDADQYAALVASIGKGEI